MPIAGSPGSSDRSAAAVGSLGTWQIVRPAVTNNFSAVTAESQQCFTVHRRSMARLYQSKAFGISEQLSSRNCNTGYRQAVHFCLYFLVPREALVPGISIADVFLCAQLCSVNNCRPYGSELWLQVT